MKAKLAIILICLLGVSCGKGQKNVQAFKKNEPLQTVLEVPLTQARAVLAKNYRLKPDNRFMLAVTDIQHLLSAEPGGEPDWEFTDGQWHVYVDRAELGRLSEFPDFAESLLLLQNWAEKLIKEYNFKCDEKKLPEDTMKGIDVDIAKFYASNIFKVLPEMDRLWLEGFHSTRLLAAGLRGHIYLYMQVLDRLDKADPIAARSLALLAILKAQKYAGLDAEEALLADCLDYSTHADNLVNKLPLTDPLRHTLQSDGSVLKTEALSGKLSPLGGFLYMKSIVAKWLKKEWQEMAASLASQADAHLAIGKSGLALDIFPLDATLPAMIISEVLRETTGREAGDKETLAEQTRRFEERMASPTASKKTFFFDPLVYQSYYRSYFYSALYSWAKHLIDHLNSVPAAQELMDAMGNVTAADPKAFKTWLDQIVKSRLGSTDLKPFFNDLENKQTLGGEALQRSLEELLTRIATSDPMKSTTMRLWIRRLDSRPQHRENLAARVHVELLDMKMYERLIDSLLAAARRRFMYIEANRAQLADDPQQMKALLNSRQTTWQKMAVVEYYNEMLKGKDQPDLEALYQSICQEAPQNWNVIESYVNYLEKNKKYRQAEKVIRSWLEHPEEISGFDSIEAQTALGRVLEAQGRIQEGLKAVQPVVESWKGNAMKCYAGLLYKAGKVQEALQMARDIVERYPDGLKGRSFLAKLYWQQGAYDEAAAMLKSCPVNIGMFDWITVIGPDFTEAFAGKSGEIAAALAAMIRKGFPAFDMYRLASYFLRQGKPAEAFAIAGTLSGKGQEKLMFTIFSYECLAEWRGKEAALAWIMERIPAQQAGPAAMLAYIDDRYELLWDLFKQRTGYDTDEFTWLLRAAAWLRQGKPADQYTPMLRSHYQGQSKIYYFNIGQYLLGMLPGETLLPMARTDKQKCEFAYYLALKAESDGRFADASDWYRVCVETGLLRNGEYIWAYWTLNRWAYQFIGPGALSRHYKEHQAGHANN
jgi:thioredoxin-like negative regulator of GroEL